MREPPEEVSIDTVSTLSSGLRGSKSTRFE
jgi:hypothetical protein